MNNSKKIKIIILADQVPSYTWDFLNKLSQFEDLDCEVWHSDKKNKISLAKQNYLFNIKYLKHIKLKYFKKYLLFQFIFSVIKATSPDVILVDPGLNIISSLILLYFKKDKRIKIIPQTHGYDRNYTNKNSLFYKVKERIRLKIAKKYDAFLFYNQEGYNYYLNNKFNPEKMFVFNNTLDTEKLFNIYNGISEIEIQDFRRSYNFGEEDKVVCFLSRLYKEKRVEDLLLAIHILQDDDDKLGLFIIGDGSTKKKLIRLSLELKLKKTYFLGDLRDDKKLGIILKSSYLMVNPGLVGLSIVHSFAFGLPFICEDLPIHSPEIIYLKNGINGFKTEPTPIGLKNKMQLLISDEKMRNEFSRNALEIYNEASITNMIMKYRSAIDCVLDV
jgi:glycosyltransferase involved in cell wall biosynthesis